MAPKPPPAKKQSPEDDVSSSEKLKLFFSVHWRGVFIVCCPIILLFMVTPFPGELYMWCAYNLVIMALFWVTECLPLAITGFLPIVILPLRGVLTTVEVCKTYVNDTIIMFLGSLFLATSVEQSGLHKRLAYFTIRTIGYSHYKLLLAMCVVTCFCSMWIQNTAATTMMVPINFALLRVFEKQNVLRIFDRNKDGEEIASDTTCCYFCAATYSATIGGIGTLVGTGTNLVFKGLFMEEYPKEPEYLSFPMFSAFGVPLMICLESALYLWLCMFYFGLFRPKSDKAKRAIIPEEVKKATKIVIEKDTKALGRLTYWEFMVIVLFGGAMVLFFCRSPQIFTGWGDFIIRYFGNGNDMKFVRDSALATSVSFLMFLLPSNLSFFKNFTAKNVEELPKRSVASVLDWPTLNRTMPYSFMFLLGGGFALSAAAKSSGLNAKLGEIMSVLDVLPSFIIVLLLLVVVIFVTNFASNVAVANVFVPISMSLAAKINHSPLWFCIIAGFSASFCFMVPVGTPGNLIVQSTAKVPTPKMLVAGLGPTISTILISWFFFTVYAPVVWPVLKEPPPEKTPTPT